MNSQNITLEGYCQQLYPSNLESLNQTYLRVGAIGSTLDRIGREINGYTRMTMPVTSDGHHWFWGLKYNFENESLEVLFPRGTQGDELNASRLERSIAVFGTTGVQVPTAESIIDELINGFRFASAGVLKIKKPVGIRL